MSHKQNLLATTLLFVFCGCGRAKEVSESSGNIGIQYREGKGLVVSQETKQSIQLKLVEVTEGRLRPVLTKSGDFLDWEGLLKISSNENSAPGAAKLRTTVTADEATFIRVGQRVELNDTGRYGQVSSIESLDVPSLPEREVYVDFEVFPEDIDRHTINLSFELDEREASAIIPRSALLRTSLGTFVYVLNGIHLFRTAIRVGASNSEFIEVTDGLYSGDEVVSQPIKTLWLAELQAIKGGVSCADGH